jgi:FlaA1/EpsC-like NDP-sugar epimerase
VISRSSSGAEPAFEDRNETGSRAVCFGQARKTASMHMENHRNLSSPVGQAFLDALIFVAAIAAAGIIGWHESSLGVPLRLFMLCAAVVPLFRVAVNWQFGVYRFIWKLVGLPDVLTIAKSAGFVTMLILILEGLAKIISPSTSWLRFRVSLVLLEGSVSLAGSIGARAATRLWHERAEKAARRWQNKVVRLLLYGAGRAGMLLYKELKGNGDFEVVGFIDDDLSKRGAVILGKKVLGDHHLLEDVVRRHRIDEVVISIASGSSSSLAEILNRCRQIPVTAKIIPSLQEIVQDRAKIGQLRDVQIEDLLGREGVEPARFERELRSVYNAKTILVTGAGGSIGSELVRQLLFFSPRSIVLLDKDENSIYELEQELVFRYPDAVIKPVIADIRCPSRMRAVFREYAPQIVFHAAAHKHVPLMEKHPCEAILNNVLGTRILLETCAEAGVEQFVFISSDKAVNPRSVMGATKRVGELLVQNYSRQGQLAAACVRFGNVAGSRGSVIPLFKRQIKEGGPVTITHPEAVRFFMTIPEAVQLVLCAGTLCAEGHVFVLDMGNPQRVVEVARNLIALSGLQPERDVQLVITGLRPGEKLFEELVDSSEGLQPTAFEKISRVESEVPETRELGAMVADLIMAAEQNDPRAVCGLLASLCKGYQPTQEAILEK